MTGLQSVYVAFMLVTALAALSLAALVWRRQRVIGSRAFAALMAAVGLWSLAYAFEIAAPSLPAKVVWAQVQYLGITAVAPAWLLFAAQYAGMRRWITRRNVLLTLAVPALTLLLVWTHGAHRLLWRETLLWDAAGFPMLRVEHGVVFWLHLAYSYLLVLAGMFVLATAWSRASGLYRRQLFVILLGVLIPWIGNALYVLGLNPFPLLDLTPFSFALTGALAAWGVFAYRLLDIVPVARSLVIEHLREAVLVLDWEGRVVEINAAACRMIGCSRADTLGQPGAEALSGFSDLVERYRDVRQMQEQVAIEQGGRTRYCELTITPLYNKREQFIGRLVVMNDVTERREAERERNRQALTFEHILDSVILTDMQGRIIDCNPATESMFGYAREELVGKPARIWHRPQESQSLTAQIQAATRTKGRWSGEISYIRKDGVEGTCEVVVIPLLNEEGEQIASIGVSHDTTQRKRAEASLVAQMQLFEHLVAVARVTSAGLNLQETLQNVLDVATTITGAELSSLFVLDEQKRVVESILTRDQVGSDITRDIVGRVMDEGLAGWSVRYRQPVLVYDTAEDDRWIRLPDQPYEARSALVVPIVSGVTVLGVLTLLHSQPGYFDPEHSYLMQAAADQMALALRNAQMYDQQQRLTERQTTLYRVLRAIEGYLELDGIARTAVETVSELTGWPAIAIVAPVGPDDRLEPLASTGWRSGSESIRLAGQGSASRSAFESGETRYIPDLADLDAASGMGKWVCELAFPLRRGDEALGVLTVLHHHAHAFQEDDLVLGESLAEAIALGLSNAQLFEATASERQRLMTVLQASHDGIIFADTHLRIGVVNDAALNYLGVQGAPAEWTGRWVQDGLLALRSRAPNLVHALMAELRRMRAKDLAAGEGECEVPPRTLHWMNLPVRRGGTAIGRLIVLRDVTKERLLERMRDDLTHTMVHDLRNPLTSLSMALGYLESLQQGAISSQQRVMLDYANGSLKKVLGLVNAILDLTRLEGGRMPLQPVPVELSEVASRVLGEQALLARQNGVRLENEIPQSLPAVLADAELIARVFQNLIGNAVKFTPDEGRVTVSAVLNRNRDAVRVSVSDTGPGIPPDLRQQLFQKFVTGGQEHSGSGLGLAFCRLAVEAHGGRIWLSERDSVGATFMFTLPLAQVSVTTEA